MKLFKFGDEVLLLGQIEVEAVPGVDFDMFSVSRWTIGIQASGDTNTARTRSFERSLVSETTRTHGSPRHWGTPMQRSGSCSAALLSWRSRFQCDYDENPRTFFERGSVVRSFSSGKNENQDEDLLTPYRCREKRELQASTPRCTGS
ncbi:hypothetical protein GQ600_23375 [Phytophthora cactorum]|nr:hypothetical protein GQ600_23375 [Phytophthora cactorum]